MPDGGGGLIKQRYTQTSMLKRRVDQLLLSSPEVDQHVGNAPFSFFCTSFTRDRSIIEASLHDDCVIVEPGHCHQRISISTLTQTVFCALVLPHFQLTCHLTRTS